MNLISPTSNPSVQARGALASYVNGLLQSKSGLPGSSAAQAV